MAGSGKSFARDVVTPVTMVLFLVSTITGVMLLLHWQSGLVRFSHEWLSLVFSAIAVWHLARNWKAFLGYLKRNLALGALVVSLVLSVGITAMTGHTGAPVSPKAVFHQVSQASVEAAAPAFGLSSQQAMDILAAAGIAAEPTDTLAALGQRSGLGSPGLMTLLAKQNGLDTTADAGH